MHHRPQQTLCSTDSLHERCSRCCAASVAPWPNCGCYDLQVGLGQVLHQLDELLPANSLPLDDLLAAALLVFFGVKTLLVSPQAPAVAASCALSHSMYRGILEGRRIEKCP